MIARRIVHKDLLSVRLASKALSTAATKPLFSRIHVSPEASTQTAYHSILERPELAKAIEAVHFTTFEGCDKTLDDYRNEETEKELSEDFTRILGSVNKFPNLQAVQVNFAQVCSSPSPSYRYLYVAEESSDFRNDVLAALFSSLNSTDRRPSSFQSLSIKNLQNFNVKSLVESHDFLSVLSRIKELRLRIVTEWDSASPEASWRFPEMHDFFTELPKTWLQPARANLESLTLHADLHWGYIPKCDLRSLHFPKLRKLELGSFSFSHDWQLEWILSHAETLEELTLDDCPIVAYSLNYCTADSENYPTDPKQDLGDPHLWEYWRTWAHYFSTFQEKLPKLQAFRYRGGNWDEDANFDGSKEASRDWREGLTANSYLNFNRGIGPSPWEEVDQCISGSDDFIEETGIVIEDRAGVYDEEDKAAYENLMTALRARQR